MGMTGDSTTRMFVDIAGGCAPPWPRRVRGASLVIIVVSVIALARQLPMDRVVAMLATKVDAIGFWGPVAFGAA